MHSCHETSRCYSVPHIKWKKAEWFMHQLRLDVSTSALIKYDIYMHAHAHTKTQAHTAPT